MLLNRSVQRHRGVSSGVVAGRQANVTDNYNEATTRHEDAMTVRPYLIKLAEEFVVVLDVAQLPGRIPILFQSPIRRGRKHQVNAFGRNCAQVPAVPAVEPVRSRNTPDGSLNFSYGVRILCEAWNRCLRVIEPAESLRDVRRQVPHRRTHSPNFALRFRGYRHAFNSRFPHPPA